MSKQEIVELKQGLSFQEVTELKEELNPVETRRLEELLNKDRENRKKIKQEYKDSLKNIPSPFAPVSELESKNKSAADQESKTESKLSNKEELNQSTVSKEKQENEETSKKDQVVSSGSFELKTFENDSEESAKTDLESSVDSSSGEKQTSVPQNTGGIKISDDVETEPLEPVSGDTTAQDPQPLPSNVEQLPTPPPPEDLLPPAEGKPAPQNVSEIKISEKSDKKSVRKKATPVKVQIPSPNTEKTKSEISEVDQDSSQEDNPNIINTSEKQVPNKGFSEIEKEFFETEITPENDYSGVEEILNQIEEKHKKKKGFFGSIKNMLVQDTSQGSGAFDKNKKKSQTKTNKKNTKSNKKNTESNKKKKGK